MKTSCENCMFWYSECTGAPEICHGSTDEDCEFGQYVEEEGFENEEMP